MLEQPLSGVDRRVDQDPPAAYPEHKARRLPVWIKAMARAEDRHPKGGRLKDRPGGSVTLTATTLGDTRDRLEGDRVA